MVKPANFFCWTVTCVCGPIFFGQKGNMNKWFERLVLTSSLVALFACVYYANSMGLMEKISIEIQRYSGLNNRHLMLITLVVLGSFLFGYLTTKVGSRRTA